MKRVSFLTLGCKVNQYETQAIKEQLLQAGCVETSPEEAVDVFVVNTCTVTEIAAAKSRRAVNNLIKKHPGARIIVTGCYIDSNPDEFSRRPGVTQATNARKAGLVAEFLKGDAREVDNNILNLSICKFDKHTRAFLKVEDGCDLHCTYCIIPQVRGPVCSRTIADCLMEAGRLVANGHKEIILTGIHLGAFGRGSRAEGETLPGLLAELAPLPGLERLRLSSIEINEITQDLLDVVAAHPNICPHFHLPLQAGHDLILKRMGRKYRRDQVLKVTGEIKSRWPRPALTTDIIVGFPGETEEHWRATLDLCRQVAFMKIHIFPYSYRQGTPAAGFKGHLSGEIINRRKAELAVVGMEMALDYKRQFLGEIVYPLIETTRDNATGKLTGMTERYLRTLIDGPDDLGNKIVPVQVQQVTPGQVLGQASFSALEC
ncbi:tRNA (N(6)-L-threonylcarbamoyladenosine(37)-C(2))-methylthiotransferase MtaB [Planctomycetota bacterium]